MPVRKVGITSKPKKEEIKEVVPRLLSWFAARQIEAFIDQETGASLENCRTALSREDLAALADLIVVLGGDGTLLATARAIKQRPLPILAVNLGGLGFLTDITLEELYPTLATVLEGSFKTDRRVRLQAEVLRDGQPIASFLALNDAVLNKGAIARVLDFDLWVDGRFMSTYKSDGLIVSTPTGSTAYSLAAGGPVMAPTVAAFIVTPICAHTLTNRAIVLPDTVSVDVAMKSHQESVYLTVDGQVAVALRSNDVVRVKKSASWIELVQPPDRTYFQVLRQKLKWGGR